MPFTFSHPAIVLPLAYLPKRWISVTGLVLGSLMPDFEYFLRMKIQSNFSHTLEGIFWFDLPLGLLTAFVFHNLIRNHLFANLPKMLKSRFMKYTNFNWNSYSKTNWFVVIISILIGTISHIFWDSFTHDTGYFVKTIPFLSNSMELLDYRIPVLKILQHSSTLVGAFIICISIYKLPTSQINNASDNYYWIIFITSFILLFFLLIGFQIPTFGTLLVSTISLSMLSLIITSLLTNIKKCFNL